MHLYNYTISKSTLITSSLIGNFTSEKLQDIIIIKNNRIELYKINESGKLDLLLSCNTFANIRSISTFKLPGSKRDYIIIGSDSGKLIILLYNNEKNKFSKVHDEIYGKSGCRRIIAGQYVASDPRGRAVMYAGIEKQKLVYILNRDSNMNMTISSPLEANKLNTLCFCICGVDVGFENPIFAAIEVDYEELDQPSLEPKPFVKLLTFYELDLGLNHVIRKWTEPIDPTANLLITVPGSTDGPGGVLICSENTVYWKNQDKPELSITLPRRAGTDERGLLIISHTMYRTKDLLFFILQSELGDLYKLTLDYKNDQVTDMRIKYFDTCPPCISLNITRSGLLFAASEMGNSSLFQIQSLGDDDNTIETSSMLQFNQRMSGYPFQHLYFSPRPIRNLQVIDELDSMAPLLDMKVADLTGEQTPQFYAACGRGSRSTFKILRQGLAVAERAVTELQGNPNAVWSVKISRSDQFDSYLIVSFLNSTIVLSIGETVQEINDSGFLDTNTSIHVSLLGENSLLQVHPDGIRHIRHDKRITEWKPPGKKKITRATSNERQVVVALTGGELIFFELDRTDQLLDVEKQDMGADITCLALPPIAAGGMRAKFVGVGLFDNTVRVLTLDPANPLQQLTMQAVQATPHSLVIASIATSFEHEDLVMFTGLQNGVMTRALLDPIEGKLSDTRKRFMGTRPVKVFPVTVHGTKAVICLSSRSWLSYTYQGRHLTTPLSYESLEYCSFFSSELVPEGVVSISGDLLRIFNVEKLGDCMNSVSVPLRYTPRKLLVDAERAQMIIVEADHNAFSVDELNKIKSATGESNAMAVDVRVKIESGDSMDISDSALIYENPSEEQLLQEKLEAFIGPLKGGPGKWASCIRLVNPVLGQTSFLLELKDNEAAFCSCLVRFSSGEETFLAVGVAKDLVLIPRSHSACYINLYKFVNNGKGLELVHKTPVENVVLSLTEMNGQLLAGVGRAVRLYDFGKKKLLRKSELNGFPTLVNSLSVIRNRIYGGDASEGFQFVKYRASDRTMYVFAENVTSHYLTSSCIIDYDTMAGGDKFGNLLISRLPREFVEDVEDTSAATVNTAVFNNTTNKLIDLAHFYTGETITSVNKVSLMPGGTEVILYSTIMGTIGCLVPFTNKDDVDFFSHLEIHMRMHSPSIVGRDHLAYRSYYFPVKSVIDGDLCEQYSSLDYSIQKSIASDLARGPNEVAKKLEEIRNRVM